MSVALTRFVALGACLSMLGCPTASVLTRDDASSAADAPRPGEDGGPVRCTHDIDGDGEIDDRCPDGTDCNDDAPSVGRGMDELCGNLADDDCDGLEDEAECTGIAGSSCEEPTVINATTAVWLAPVTGDTRIVADAPGAPGAEDACGPIIDGPYAIGRVRVDLAERSSLTVRVDDGSSVGPFLALVESCGGAVSRCGEVQEGSSAHSAILVAADLAAGSHWIEVAWAHTEPHPIEVRVEIRPPLTTPTNDLCAGATTIAPSGGSLPAEDLSLAADDLSLACELADTRYDLFYAIDLAEPADLAVTVIPLLESQSGWPFSIAVLGETGCESTEPRRCTSGPTLADRSLRARSLPRGRHVIVIQGRLSARFRALFEVLPPTPILEGESCDDPAPMLPDVPVTGTWSAHDRDILELGSAGTPDVVYDFELTEPRDVEIVATGARPMLFASCGDIATVPRHYADFPVPAGSPAPAESMVHGLALAPGRYFVVLFASLDPTYTAELHLSAPRAPTVVSGNETCATAATLPTPSAFVRGTTREHSVSCATPGDPFFGPTLDAFHRIEITEPSIVRAWTFPPPGAVHYPLISFMRGACADGAECHGGTFGTAAVAATAGTYFVMIDAPSTACEDAYFHCRFVAGREPAVCHDERAGCYATAPDLPYELVVEVVTTGAGE
jgi:hypothetical protein